MTAVHRVLNTECAQVNVFIAVSLQKKNSNNTIATLNPDMADKRQEYIGEKSTTSTTTASNETSDIDGWTAAEERALVTKLDLRIVPLVTVLYLLCFLDRYVPTPQEPALSLELLSSC